MTTENLSGGAKPDLTQARDEVNKLLHELENMVDEVQHASLTNYLAEWAVLSAMRTTLALQEKTTQAGTTGEGAL